MTENDTGTENRDAQRNPTGDSASEASGGSSGEQRESVGVSASETSGGSSDDQRESVGVPTSETSGGSTDERSESVGVSVPDDHVGAFVAQAFEDVERDTAWEEVVDQLVADEAREEWDDLSTTEQVEAVLSAAADYDERAADLLADVPVDRDRATPEVREAFEEAKRCRRNADGFRDGVAAAHSDGRVGDGELVAAVEGGAFDAKAVAEREDELDRVAGVYDFDYRPYGGTLFHEEDGEPGEATDPAADFEAW